MAEPARHPTQLPVSCPPRGLNREQAAEYVGVKLTKFLEMVEEGLMPRPKHIGTRTVWDRVALDAAFDALPDSGEASESSAPQVTANPWDSLKAKGRA